MEEDYELIVKKISDTYNRTGYGYLWANLKEYLENLGKEKSRIILKAVDSEFLAVRNGNPNTRIFGSFDERDIKGLVRRCRELEETA